MLAEHATTVACADFINGWILSRTICDKLTLCKKFKVKSIGLNHPKALQAEKPDFI